MYLQHDPPTHSEHSIGQSPLDLHFIVSHETNFHEIYVRYDLQTTNLTYHILLFDLGLACGKLGTVLDTPPK